MNEYTVPNINALLASNTTLSPMEQRRLRMVLESESRYIDHPILALKSRNTQLHSGSQPYDRQALTTRPSLDKEQVLFLQLNYARRTGAELRRRNPTLPLSDRIARQLLRWETFARTRKYLLAQMHAKWLQGVVKRFLGDRNELFDDGVDAAEQVLSASIDCFDIQTLDRRGRPMRLSGYAMVGIQRTINRVKAANREVAWPVTADGKEVEFLDPRTKAPLDLTDLRYQVALELEGAAWSIDGLIPKEASGIDSALGRALGKYRVWITCLTGESPRFHRPRRVERAPSRHPEESVSGIPHDWHTAWSRRAVWTQTAAFLRDPVSSNP